MLQLGVALFYYELGQTLLQMGSLIWIKGAHQSKISDYFNCPHKISPSLYFDRLLKVYKILAKKYRGVMSRDSED